MIGGARPDDRICADGPRLARATFMSASGKGGCFMARYRVRVRIETALAARRDYTFEYAGSEARFLFSSRRTDRELEAEVESTGANWDIAVRNVIDSVIPPTLDIIAFHRHTPMLLSFPTRVLKAEPGQRLRRAILTNMQSWPMTVDMDDRDVQEIRRLLSAKLPVARPALRWLRNAFRPLTILERFMFSRLALESIAGAVEVERECPTCGYRFPRYRSANRKVAREVLDALPTGISNKQFARLWFDLRNIVFHGDKEPDSALLGELRTGSDTILEAVTRRLLEITGIDGRFRTAIPIGPEQLAHRHHFIEFNTKNEASDFAEDVPEVEAVESALDGGLDLNAAGVAGLLAWRETEGW